MNTKKLYDDDSHISKFTAKVVNCRKSSSCFEIILDQTAFFPEGGGQNADTGFIGKSKVNDVQIINDEIIHFTDQSVNIGEEIECKIDWAQRFRRMQNHSGEHIVSGIVHKLYGFDNVGFHMSDDVTVDFNGDLSRKQLLDIEQKANEAIYKNVKFTCCYPNEKTLKNLNYRSKLELTGNIRIVTIDGYDVCACCAPHVYSAGEIGIIKILDFNRHRGGTRVHLLCGTDALEDYEIKYNNLKTISNLLCTKQNEAAKSFEQFYSEYNTLKAELAFVKKELAKIKTSQIENTNDCIIFFESNSDINEMRKTVLAGAKKTSKLCAVFSGNNNDGYRFAIASNKIDLKEKSEEIMQTLKGRGGGSSELIQGSTAISKVEIEKYFKENY